MATPSSYHPSQLELSQSVGNGFTKLKPSLVKGNYTDGAPSASTIKPCLLKAGGTLKDSLLTAAGQIKASLGRALVPTLTVDALSTKADTTTTLADQF